MKTLIFNGSPRPNGDTLSLVKKLLDELKGDYMIVDAYKCNIKPCIDCRFCRENEGCFSDDGWYELDKYIKECDNIVIASPIYFSELTGELLSCLSKTQSYYSARRFRNEEMIDKEKKGGIILVGGGDGNMEFAIKTATCILHLLRVKEIAPVVISHNTDNVEAVEDKAACEKIRLLADFLNDL